jgi:protein-S-isoprenylcysteine O-methyltransferase Ste14
MSAANVIVLVVVITSLTWHVSAAATTFTRPTGVTAPMVLIAASFVASVAMNVLVISKTVIGLYTLSAALLVYFTSAMLFGLAREVNRAKLLSAAYSNDLPQHLVTQGPYRFVRHPFYVSYCLTWLAGAIACSSTLLIVVFAWMFILYCRAARFEERKFAASRLAKLYSAYCEEAGMLTPRWKTLRAAFGRTSTQCHN